jgi:3-phosphoshikimate 1-carboxyvinyltransferase
MTGQLLSVEEMREALEGESPPRAGAAATDMTARGRKGESPPHAGAVATDMNPLSFRAPGSKSQTQRALILAGLAQGESTLLDPLDCDDSQTLRRGLEAIGVAVDEGATAWHIRGGDLCPPQGPLWCGEAGTTSRFLTPLGLLVDQLSLDGSERLRERPLGPLLRALERLGLQVQCHAREDALPVTLRRDTDLHRETWIDVSRSSQYLSGLLMVGPCLPDGLTLEARTGQPAGPVSRPYLEMTRDAMRAFGATVEVEGHRYRIPHARYRACRFQVEGDWSGAAFLLAGGRIVQRPVRLQNINQASTQGDRAIVGFLERLEHPRPHRFDLTDCPDLIAPLAAAAVTATYPVELVGVSHTRIKESDRVAVLARGLRAVGVVVEEGQGSLTISPCKELLPACLDPAGDHRMAMAFGLLSLRQPGIEVQDPGCVTKSYPSFWDHLERFR